jgi:UDP-N-acetylglucosamine--N-acetylmuramyl-(pentapeptide) pyrophosphoryl-undecaprenol N-acetylglucosamine transferase
MNKKLKILISGGGTGGHIFPAIAIANAIKDQQKDAEIHFVGAIGKMEMEKVPLAGYSITGLWISGMQRRLTIKNLLFPLKVLVSLIKANSIINKFQPDLVIGTGGYASGPLLYVASKKKIPTLIHEQNAFPGITNKLLSKSVTKVCVSYPEMDKYFPKDKIIITGNPIRKELQDLTPTKNESLEFFNLNQSKRTLLIIGGSQGAKQINLAIGENIQSLLDIGLQILWQTGSSSLRMAKEYAGEHKDIVIHEFIQRMDMAYQASDFIISRAGAIAIAEIISVSRPAIFIPLPSAAEDHQTKNALSLAEGNAALLIREKNAVETLTNTIKNLVNNKELQKQLITNLDKYSYPKAAYDIAKVAINLVNGKND